MIFSVFSKFLVFLVMAAIERHVSIAISVASYTPHTTRINGNNPVKTDYFRRGDGN